jgi:limonene 1,2-monooxygenase
MEEALDVMMRLFRGETVTYECEWFTLRDARLQLRPYSDPCFDIAVAASFSPTGARAAGRHGIGMLSVAATAKQGMDLLAHHWNPWAELGEESGHPADRSKWRLVGPMHLAETREQAERDVEYGIAQFSRYFTHVLPAGPVQGDTAAEIIANNQESGFAVIGTPDDAVARIRELLDASNGGFGAFLLFDHDWANPAAKLRSYDLFAQYVMPHFTGQLAGPRASQAWVLDSGTEFMDRAAHAIGKAIEDHATEQAAKQA